MIPKFRAYDKQTGQMFNVRELILNKDSVRAVRVIGQTSKSRYKKSDFMYSDRFELMQWTGLTDKEGREIYEGDIITYLDLMAARDFDITHEVKMVKEEFDYGDYGKEERYCWNVHLEHKPEVIGNIYQNPELLK